LKEDSEGKFRTQPGLLSLLTKNDEFPLNTNLFRKSKNYLASSRRNFEINKNDEKKYNSKYIALVPTYKNIYPYEMLKTKDYDNSPERFEIPARCHNQYLFMKKITDSINQYPSDEYSEEFEELSDFSRKNAENILDEEIDTSKSEQEASTSIECNESDYELEKEDEDYRDVTEGIDKSLETKNPIFDNREIFFLRPWNHENKRHRRNINERTDQVKSEVNIFLI